MRKIAVIGVGSYQAEDQLGWLVVDQLQTAIYGIPNVFFFKSRGNGLDWADFIKDASSVIFVDAVISNTQPGAMYEINIASQADIEKNILVSSSHGIDLFNNINLANALGMIDFPITFVGGEIDNSECVESGRLNVTVEKIVSRIKEIIEFS